MKPERETGMNAMRRAGLVALVSTAGLAQGHAGDAAALREGAYEVEVRLELPHVDDATARQTVTVCIVEAARDGTFGLAVLSANNPLARCPAENVRLAGDTLTFDIICQGGNAARGAATYALSIDRFRGRIAMKMGGKNMTMSETQSGRRIGACEPGAPPRS
jgi:hypothetical protein